MGGRRVLRFFPDLCLALTRVSVRRHRRRRCEGRDERPIANLPYLSRPARHQRGEYAPGFRVATRGPPSFGAIQFSNSGISKFKRCQSVAVAMAFVP